MTQEPFDIEFKEIFFAIIRRWYIVIILVVGMAGAMTYLKGGGVTTYYETSTRLIMGNSIDQEGKSFNIQDLQVYQNYMNTYVVMLKTDMIIDRAVEKISFKTSSGAVRGSVNAYPQADTQFLDLRLTWPNKEEAVEVLQVVAETYVEEMKTIYPAINLQIMDKVKEPVTRTSGQPRRVATKTGAILGGILSILVIFALEFLDNTVKNEKEIERYLKSYLLATIPKQKRKIKNIDLNNRKVMNAYFLEAYRRLRTNLEFLSINYKINTIVITGSKSGEGKSTTAALLATVMALGGKRTIIVDCDLRKPSIEKLFNIEESQGIGEIVLGSTTLEEAIQPTKIENLLVLPAGISPINPSEVLCSDKMKQIMEQLKQDYDYVIMDSPPVNIVADAQILTQYAEGCILTSMHRKTNIKDLKKCKNLMDNVGARILGVVINKKKEHIRIRKYDTYYPQAKKRKTKVNSKAKTKVDTHISIDDTVQNIGD